MESPSPKPECRYCGNAHDVAELCRPRRVGRRAFLMAIGAAAAGVVAAKTIGITPGFNAAAKANVGALTAEMMRKFNEKLIAEMGRPRYPVIVLHESIARAYIELTDEDRRYVGS